MEILKSCDALFIYYLIRYADGSPSHGRVEPETMLEDVYLE